MIETATSAHMALVVKRDSTLRDRVIQSINTSFINKAHAEVPQGTIQPDPAFLE